MYKLKDFSETGVCWPQKIDQNLLNLNLEEEYFVFQEKAKKIMGREITIKPNLISTFFDKIAFDKNIINAVKKIIGNNIYIWSSALFSKPPGTGKVVSYHQDNPYWQLTSDKVVSAWVALTNSDKEAGALEVFPYSHQVGIINKLDVENPRKAYLNGLKTTKLDDMLSYKQELSNFLKTNKSKIVNLNPGEFSIHHVNTVHGSHINRSSKYRIGFAIRYISVDTKHSELKKDYALHVTGSRNDYFINEKRPTEDFNLKDISNYNLSMSSGGAFGNKKY